MFLQSAPQTEAASRLFEKDIEGRGFVMNLSRAWAWRPDVCEAFLALRTQLTSGSALSQRELAVLVCATAANLGDSYCALAWGKTLAAAADAATASAVLRTSESAGLTLREQALAQWAHKVVTGPSDTQPQDVDALRTAGLSDKEVFEATVFISFRLAFSTVNGALGVAPDWQVAKAAPAEVRDAVTYGRASAPSDA